MSTHLSEDERRTHVATLRKHLADKPLLSPRLRDAIEAAIQALQRPAPAPIDR